MMAVLKAEHIKKSFGGQEIIKDVSLEVNKGDVISLIGPSGSGKTTFLRCLNFLEKADGGKLTISGKTYDLAKSTDKDGAEVRKFTGFVFQNYNLYSNQTVLHNVTLGLTVARKMSKEAADHIGMSMLKKVGMADRAGDYPAALSGGEKQRVAIARALASNPEIIYFDEPTSALDPERIDEVLQVMKNIAEEGRTMIVVTHEMAFARDVSTRTIFMENGLIVEEGESKEFFAYPENERTAEFLRLRKDEWL